MSRMTCRPRLRQRPSLQRGFAKGELRRGENGFVFVVAICLGLMVTSVRGGSMDAPASPTNALSAMWTLENIYNVLDTRTTNVTKRTNFAGPSGGPTNGTMHTLNDIMMLVTNRAPVSKTKPTTSYTPSDDGWYSTNVGVAWPTQRFTAVATSGDATNQIRDNMTGLIWARNANLASNASFNADWSSVYGTCTWAQAFDVITNSAGPVNGGAGYGGTNDWRLPDVRELFSLVDLGQTKQSTWLNSQGFIGVQSAYYFSSTTLANQAGYAFGVSLDSGGEGYGKKTAAPVMYYYVWPVRGGGQ